MMKIASKIIILYNLNKNILIKNKKKFLIVLYENKMRIYYFIL